MMNLPTKKVCSKCFQELSIDRFYKAISNRDGVSKKCKTCTYTKVYVKTLPSKHKKIKEEGRKKCRGCLKILDFDEFMKSSQGQLGLASRCKKCRSGERVSRLFKGASTAEQVRIRERIWRASKKDEGLCTRCGLNPLFNSTSCQECRDKRHLSRLAKKTQWIRQGLCRRCGKGKEEDQYYCVSCRKTCREIERRKTKLLRAKVLDYLGNQCVCCGESTPLFLTLDHINNDGNKDRKSNCPDSLYRAILKGKRIDIQILCFNCNCGKGINGGVCPHISPTLQSQ